MRQLFYIKNLRKEHKYSDQHNKNYTTVKDLSGSVDTGSMFAEFCLYVTPIRPYLLFRSF